MPRVVLTPVAAVSLEFVFLLIATSFVSLRVYNRLFRNNVLSASDYTVVTTWLCFVATATFDAVMVKNGFNDPNVTLATSGEDSAFVVIPHSTLRNLLKMLLASSVPYYISLWGVKFALIFLYYDLFTPAIMPRKFRFLLHALTAYICMSFIVVMIVNIFWCIPLSGNWNVDHPEDACITYFEYDPYIISLALHISSELFIYTLPLPVFKLRLSKQYFYSALAMFVVGFVGVCVTIGRVVVVFKVTGQPVISIFQTLAALEQMVGLLVVCLPALKNFLLRHKQRASVVRPFTEVESGGNTQPSMIGYERPDSEPGGIPGISR